MTTETPRVIDLSIQDITVHQDETVVITFAVIDSDLTGQTQLGHDGKIEERHVKFIREKVPLHVGPITRKEGEIPSYDPIFSLNQLTEIALYSIVGNQLSNFFKVRSEDLLIVEQLSLSIYGPDYKPYPKAIQMFEKLRKSFGYRDIVFRISANSPWLQKLIGGLKLSPTELFQHLYFAGVSFSHSEKPLLIERASTKHQ